MVFRSAVESIRGTFIASQTKEREAMVGSVLQRLADAEKIKGYQHTGGSERTDFKINVDKDYDAAIEVKGGEGNSINISDRPAGAREFALWCHLDGGIVNQPSKSAHKVIGRIVNEMTSYSKQVDLLFIRDKICGSAIRPCPKYRGADANALREKSGICPDIFFFPQHVPTADIPNPPVHTMLSLKLPKLMLELFEVPEEQRVQHLWEVRVSLVEVTEGKMKGKLPREVSIWHEGVQVDKFIARKSKNEA